MLADGLAVLSHLAAAGSRPSVCPQFDAALRGVPDAAHNAAAVPRAAGLTTYADRWAASLSGSNRLKLSLGIALMGNRGVEMVL